MKFTKVINGTSFIKAFKQYSKKDHNFKNDFIIFFKDFSSNPINPKFKFHKLKWVLKWYYSAKIKYDLRLIFKYKENEIVLYDIWTHDEVYK